MHGRGGRISNSCMLLFVAAVSKEWQWQGPRNVAKVEERHFSDERGFALALIEQRNGLGRQV